MKYNKLKNIIINNLYYCNNYFISHYNFPEFIHKIILYSKIKLKKTYLDVDWETKLLLKKSNIWATNNELEESMYINFFINSNKIDDFIKRNIIHKNYFYKIILFCLHGHKFN